MEKEKIWVIANGKSFDFNGIKFSKKPVQVKNGLLIRSLLKEKPSSLKQVDEPKKKVKKDDKKTKGGKK